MAFLTDTEDYWTNLSNAPAVKGGAASLLRVVSVGGVEPLDAQMGVMPPLTVPPALQDALFGTAATTDREAGKAPTICAILDGAKLTGLPEMLEASGLDYACLFEGQAAEELHEVAPWIVRLEDGNRFTQMLFTVGDAPWMLWGKEAGIIVRAAATLDELRRHFRRFTRVQDATGAWFYLRFYEPQLAHDYMRGIAGDATRLQRWLGLASGARVDMLTLTGPQRDWSGPRVATWFQLSPDAQVARPNTVFRLDTLEMEVFARHRRDDFSRRLDAHLLAEVPEFSALEPADRHNRIENAVALAAQFGVTREQAVADVALAAALNPMPLLDDPRSRRLLEADMHPLDKGARLLEHAKSLTPTRTRQE